LDTADANAVRGFSARAFEHAVRNRKVRLPPGLFNAVFAYAVAIADTVDDEAALIVRETTPRHWVRQRSSSCLMSLGAS
jgi:hypothetical protein